MTRDTDDARPAVFTAGHSDRQLEELLELLAGAGVGRVVDVRLAPWSRRHPWHSRPQLEKALTAAGIDYVWLGGMLGGLRPEGYEEHQATEEYRKGIVELEALATERPTAVLCAERDPNYCHRRFIADDLARDGYLVWHLIDPGERRPHQPPLL